MIDTVKYYVPIPSSTFLEIFTKEEGGFLKYRKIKLLNGVQYKVFPGRDQCSMMIETSLAKVVQGHNVCGTNDIALLCREVTRITYRELGIKLSLQEKKDINRMHFKLGRVDFTGWFDMGSQSAAVEVLSALPLQLKARGLHIVVHEGPDGVETIYIGKESKRTTAKFYNKYLELQARPLPESLPFRQDIEHYAKGLVRFEITLRDQELTDRGISNTKKWNSYKVRSMLAQKLFDFRFSGELVGLDDAPSFDKLKPSLETLCNLWWEGANLRKHMTRGAFNRTHKRVQHAYPNINIGIRAHNHATKLSLKAMLSSEALRFAYPRSFRECGAIYCRKNKVADEATDEPEPAPNPNLAQLRVLVERLRNGYPYSDKELIRYFDSKTRRDFKNAMQATSPNTPRSVLRDLKGYHKYMAIGDRSTRQYWATSNKIIAKKHAEIADDAYSAAYEQLEEATEFITEIGQWFDRPVDYGLHGIDTYDGGMPRLRDSKSIHNRVRDFAKQKLLAKTAFLEKLLGLPSSIKDDEKVEAILPASKDSEYEDGT